MKIGLVWATNVGKSTLFNRLIWQFRAIVTDIPWTTIDIVQHNTKIESMWDVIFSDSPGLHDFAVERVFIKKIIDESDIILFLVDDKVGITAKEQNISDYIRKQHKQENSILIINKLDIKRKESQTSLALSEYYWLWYDNMIGISAKTTRNMDELQEMIVKLYRKLKKNKKIDKNPTDKTWMMRADNSIPLAILWKPNVWKSTLLNTLTGKYLSKVEDTSGTTRDYIVWWFTYNSQKYTVYDTAWIKKKWHMLTLEKIAYDKTKEMVKYIRPVVFFIIDAEEEISHRDMTLLEEINNFGLPIIIWLNKTDLLNKSQIENAIKKTQATLSFAKYIPIIPIVATTWKGSNDLLKMASTVRSEMIKRIETNLLNKVISSELIARPPRFSASKICKIFYLTQIDIDAPTFQIFVNHKNRVNFAFRKRIDNSLRKHFGFIGTPLVLRFTERNKKWGIERGWEKEKKIEQRRWERMDKEVKEHKKAESKTRVKYNPTKDKKPEKKTTIRWNKNIERPTKNKKTEKKIVTKWGRNVERPTKKRWKKGLKPKSFKPKKWAPRLG